MICLVIDLTWVNKMNRKLHLCSFFVVLLSGCAFTGETVTNDPVRTRVLAELVQAKADGLVPVSEVQYMYPWPAVRSRDNATSDATNTAKRTDANAGG